MDNHIITELQRLLCKNSNDGYGFLTDDSLNYHINHITEKYQFLFIKSGIKIWNALYFGDFITKLNNKAFQKTEFNKTCFEIPDNISYILIPLNHAKHWSLCIWKILKSNNQITSANIYYIDPLHNGGNWNFWEPLLPRFFYTLIEVKYPNFLPNLKINQYIVPVKNTQPNMYDCGPYTISYMMEFILGIQIGHTWFDHKLYRHNYAYHLVSLWVEKIKNSFKCK